MMLERGTAEPGDLVVVVVGQSDEKKKQMFYTHARRGMEIILV